MSSLAGKVAVVTAGARGIGFACGKVFGARGAKVMLSDTDGEELEKAVKVRTCAMPIESHNVKGGSSRRGCRGRDAGACRIE